MKKIKKVKEYLVHRRKFCVLVRPNKLILPIEFKVNCTLPPTAYITTDRDIYYGDSLVVAAGGRIPYYSPAKITTGFIYVILDLRGPGQFNNSDWSITCNLTKEFVATLHLGD